MSLLLDTSVAIALIEGDAAAMRRWRDYDEAAFLSVISRVELTPGRYVNGILDPVGSARFGELLNGLAELPFTTREAEAYDRIIAVRGFSRRLVVDRMIAATALANDLGLATLNPRDFRDIPGLELEDWSA